MPKQNYCLLSAGPLRRLTALVYDSFLLFALAVAYAGTVLALRVAISGQAAAVEPFRGWSAVFYGLGLWSWLGLFYCWCWRRNGQTLGMKTWRLQLQQRDGSKPTWPQCMARCLLAPLSYGVFCVGVLWCLGQSGRCWHDLWTATRVVVLAKE